MAQERECAREAEKAHKLSLEANTQGREENSQILAQLLAGIERILTSREEDMKRARQDDEK